MVRIGRYEDEVIVDELIYEKGLTNGDLIQRLTNDLYLANMHRVVNTSGRQRYSIPFFIDADFDAVIKPLDSCVSEANPLRYQPVTCGAHKFGRFVASYAHLANYRTAS